MQLQGSRVSISWEMENGDVSEHFALLVHSAFDTRNPYDLYLLFSIY